MENETIKNRNIVESFEMLRFESYTICSFSTYFSSFVEHFFWASSQFVNYSGINDHDFSKSTLWNQTAVAHFGSPFLLVIVVDFEKCVFCSRMFFFAGISSLKFKGSSRFLPTKLPSNISQPQKQNVRTRKNEIISNSKYIIGGNLLFLLDTIMVHFGIHVQALVLVDFVIW